MASFFFFSRFSSFFKVKNNTCDYVICTLDICEGMFDFFFLYFLDSEKTKKQKKDVEKKGNNKSARIEILCIVFIFLEENRGLDSTKFTCFNLFESFYVKKCCWWLNEDLNSLSISHECPFILQNLALETLIRFLGKILPLYKKS